jgi:hypothetical protein
MADQITIPTDLLAEVRADLEAGGDRAKRWRPAPPEHRFGGVLVLQGGDRGAGLDAAGWVGEVRGMSTVDGYPNVVEVAVLLPGEWFADATGWALVGDVDTGPRPVEGDRIAVLTDEGGDCPEPWIGHVTYAPPGIGVVMATMATDGHLAAQEAAVSRWAILPPEIPTEVHALHSDLDEALDVATGLAAIIGQPQPSEASAEVGDPHARIVQLRSALREIVNTLGPGGPCLCHAPDCGLRAEAAEALRVATEALEASSA